MITLHLLPFNQMTDHEDSQLKDQSIQYRRKYFALRNRACESIEDRDEILKEMQDMRIHEANYDFDPETYRTDALIPKGGILQAIRDAS